MRIPPIELLSYVGEGKLCVGNGLKVLSVMKCWSVGLGGDNLSKSHVNLEGGTNDQPESRKVLS